MEKWMDKGVKGPDCMLNCWFILLSDPMFDHRSLSFLLIKLHFQLLVLGDRLSVLYGCVCMEA